MISKFKNGVRWAASKISNAVAMGTCALAAVFSTAPAPVAEDVMHQETVAVQAVEQVVEQVSLFDVGSGFLPFAVIDLSDFTDALGEVGTAVTAALGSTVTAGLAIAGVIMGGLLLWKLFKSIAKA